MSDADALLAAIREHPDEDTPRLAYADWLQEHGRPERAEFIRAQIELARLPDDDPGRTDLEITERRLLARYGNEWAAPCVVFENTEGCAAKAGAYRSSPVVFRRGFVEAVTNLRVTVDNKTRYFDEVAAAHPLRDMSSDVLSWGLDQLSATNRIQWVEAVSLGLGSTFADAEANHRQFEAVRQFLAGPQLQRLRRLWLSVSRYPSDPSRHLPAGGLVELLHLPCVCRLAALRLPGWSGEPFEDGAIRELTRGSFPNLCDLGFEHFAPVGQAAELERFVESETWRRLTRFRLAGRAPFPWGPALRANRLEQLQLDIQSAGAIPAFVDAVAKLAAPATLKELDFAFSEGPHGEDLSRLLAADATRGLRRLSTRDMTADDLARLARAPVLRQLNRLTVSLRGDGESGLATLLGSPHLGSLTHLTVRYDAPVEAIRALATNPAARRLRTLDVGHFGTREQRDALISGGPFPDLHTVKFSHLSDEEDFPALEQFLRSPNLPRLRVVRFCWGNLDRYEQIELLQGFFRRCEGIVWAGGEMGDPYDSAPYVDYVGGTRAVFTDTPAFLPHHLDDVP